MQNQATYKNNVSGYPGVSFYSANSKWRSAIGYKGLKKHLGYFDTPEEAHQSYLNAKAIHHTFNPIPREASYASI